MSDHVVYLLGGEQPQREGAPLILDQQLGKNQKKSQLKFKFLLIYPVNLFMTDETDIFLIQCNYAKKLM